MIWGIVAIVLPLVGWGVFATVKWAGAVGARTAADERFRKQCDITDGVQAERDASVINAVRLVKQNEELQAAQRDAQARITELSEKVLRLTTGNLAKAPLEEGAAAVNAMFAAPWPKVRGPGEKP